eukprot:COSAG02_NODE_17394_length_1007_cov_1.250000_1_plen_201_part_00
MQTATIFAPPSSISACPTKHTYPKQNLRNRWVTHICTLAVEKHTSDVPACQRISQRTCWSQPVVSWDSRNAATQSVRTGTACRLHWLGTLTCMVTTADEILAHWNTDLHHPSFPERWNTRLFHWNTRASPSVPDQIVAQRPETHNAHIFSVIGDGRKMLERWNTHIRQSSSGPAGPSSAPRCHRGACGVGVCGGTLSSPV